MISNGIILSKLCLFPSIDTFRSLAREVANQHQIIGDSFSRSLWLPMRRCTNITLPARVTFYGAGPSHVGVGASHIVQGEVFALDVAEGSIGNGEPGVGAVVAVVAFSAGLVAVGPEPALVATVVVDDPPAHPRVLSDDALKGRIPAGRSRRVIIIIILCRWFDDVGFRAHGIIGGAVRVGVFEVALQGLGKVTLVASTGYRIFLPVVVVRGDVLVGAVAEIEEIPADGVGKTASVSASEGSGVLLKNVQVLVATTPDGAISVDFEKDTPFVFPVIFLGGISNGVLPGFTVQFVFTDYTQQELVKS